MMDHTFFDSHLLYALATLGALLLLRSAWGLLARAQAARPPGDPAGPAVDAVALHEALARYALTLEAFEAPPAEPQVLEATLAQQLARILALQRAVLPQFAERAAQLQAAHGRLMDFLWRERLLSIRHDRLARRDPEKFAALSRELRAVLQDLCAGCVLGARDEVATPPTAALA